MYRGRLSSFCAQSSLQDPRFAKDGISQQRPRMNIPARRSRNAHTLLLVSCALPSSTISAIFFSMLPLPQRNCNRVRRHSSHTEAIRTRHHNEACHLSRETRYDRDNWGMEGENNFLNKGGVRRPFTIARGIGRFRHPVHPSASQHCCLSRECVCYVCQMFAYVHVLMHIR